MPTRCANSMSSASNTRNVYTSANFETTQNLRMVYERLGGKQASGFFLSSSILFFLAICAVIIHTQQPSGAPKCALGAIVSFIMNTFTFTLVALLQALHKMGMEMGSVSSWSPMAFLTWGSGPLLHMAGYSSLQGIGISLLKYRWCYESVQNYGTKLEKNVHTTGGLIFG